ncbi:MAG: hypothetical protein P1P88_01015, partial [Bacteroidales bacterium]|nr:hypothetical protein [Bacteroidales bacterium]
MAVRLTERRIPLDFLPSDLGEVGTLKKVCETEKENYDFDNPDCYLISYLESPITVESKNTYVVFVLSESLRVKTTQYRWIIDRSLDIFRETEEMVTDEGVFNFCPSSEELTNKIKLVLEDQNGEMLRELEIVQELANKYEPLEKLLLKNELFEDGLVKTYNIACGGHPDTSREIFHDTIPYINATIQKMKDAYDNFTPPLSYDFVPRLFFISLVYSRMLKINKEEREEEIEKIINEINEESYDDWEKPVGITQISPVKIAMLLKNPITLEETYLPWGELSLDKGSHDDDFDTQIELFKNLNDDTKIDIVNILRFPKSNVSCCFKLLNKLKNREHRYPLLSPEEFNLEQKANEIIADEFFNGGSLIDKMNYEPRKDSLKVFYYRYLPFFNLGFGGYFAYKISGTVEDANDSSKSMKGAKIYLYKTMIIALDDTRKCFRAIEGIEDNSPETYELLEKDEKLPVLKVLRNQTIAGGNGYSIAKVRKQSSKLNNDEGYVVYKWNDNIYASLISERIGSTTPFGYVKNDNTFELFVRVYQPYFIRIVKVPDEEQNGYFDGEFNEEIDGLPFGWFFPPKDNLRIRMQSEVNMIQESTLINLFSDWLNYEYSHWYPNADAPNRQHGTDYPADYYITDVVNLSPLVMHDNEIDCTCFVECIMTELLRRNFNNDFRWGLGPHCHSMIQSFDDPFSSVNVYSKHLIWMLRNNNINPSGTEFTITINNINIIVESGNSELQTLQNIINAINNNAELSRIITASDDIFERNILIEPTENRKQNYTSSSSRNEVQLSGIVNPIIRVDISNDANYPPTWCICQGWNPDNINSGHAFFIIDVHKPTGKVLTIESNLYTGNTYINGPGFKTMGNSRTVDDHIEVYWGSEMNDGIRVGTGDIDNHILNEIVEPNVDCHWTEKVTKKWDAIINDYNGREDGDNPFGIAR